MNLKNTEYKKANIGGHAALFHLYEGAEEIKKSSVVKIRSVVAWDRDKMVE